MLIVPAVLFRLLTPLAHDLPSHCVTLGGLAKAVAGLNYGRLASELAPTGKRGILEALQYVISDAVGIEPDTLIGKNPQLIELFDDTLRAQV